MNKFERIACVFNHEIPDRVPIFDWISHAGIIERYAELPLTLENSRTVVPKASSRILDLAPLWLPADPAPHVDDRGFTVAGADMFNHWIIEPPWRDPEGMVRWVRNQVDELRAWRPPTDQGRDRERLAQQELIDRYVDTPVAGHLSEPLEAAFPAVGLENFSYLLADQPELIQEWLDALHEKNMLAIESGAMPAFDPALYPVVCLTADVAFRDKPIFSPVYLRKSGYFRRIADVCQLYHDRKVKVLYHSDGDLSVILPELIAAGIDGINPIDLGAGMDLKEVKDRYGEQLVLAGGIDGVQALPFGKPEEAIQAVIGALRIAMPGGGYILSTSCAEWTNNLPLDNLVAMLETAWVEGRYP